MASVNPESIDRDGTNSVSSRRAPLPRPQSGVERSHRVVVHLPDLTPLSARAAEKPAAVNTPAPATSASRSARIDQPTAARKPEASPQAPHFDRPSLAADAPGAGLTNVSTATATITRTDAQPFRLAGLGAEEPRPVAEGWKSRLAAWQPTIMLGLIGITAGVLIGWLLTQGKSSNAPPQEPAPSWNTNRPAPKITSPENDSPSPPRTDPWPDASEPTMSEEPPQTPVESAPANDGGYGPYDAPENVEIQVPQARGAVSPQLEGKILVEPGPAEASHEQTRTGLY